MSTNANKFEKEIIHILSHLLSIRAAKHDIFYKKTQVVCLISLFFSQHGSNNFWEVKKLWRSCAVRNWN